MAHPVDDFEDNGGRGLSSGKGPNLGKGISQKKAAIEDSKEDLKVRKGSGKLYLQTRNQTLYQEYACTAVNKIHCQV